ncbi:MAG: DPP IV N-terminal domain-containing protein [Saprospiraceae bacterium]
MVLTHLRFCLLLVCGLAFHVSGFAQALADSSKLSLDRIFSGEFRANREKTIQWVENGDGYVTIEKSSALEGADELVRYGSNSQARTLLIPATQLVVGDESLEIESFTLSPDESKVLIFTNSSRVWRTNSKGDYWVYDLSDKTLSQLGATLSSSSLMFAKFSEDNTQVFYVHAFNIYQEDFKTHAITQLTQDGTGDIINGTFDWVYEEEFGKRDGFSVNPSGKHLAFWQLDATSTGTFYMINNTDSIYSELIPVQYPKVGQEPSAAKIGLLNLATKKTIWIPIPGGERENYLPGIQWISDDLLLIQQLNRHQNKLTFWTYVPSNGNLRSVYTEENNTWVDIGYPDASETNWGNNDLPVVENTTSVLRMTEGEEWRHIHKINLASGKNTLLTPFAYDVASMRPATKKTIFYMASPENSTQRYLYQTDLLGKGKDRRVTPQKYSGFNSYNVSPNGKYAIHAHENGNTIRTVRFVSLPSHKTIKVLVSNEKFIAQLSQIDQPIVRFTQVTTEEGITVDARMVLPPSFDETKKYPILFHVYGEPWGQVAIDRRISLWNMFMAQQGYVIIDMDNRGTPALLGSKWRKSIYRKIGIINTQDQGLAAKEILKRPYLDTSRVSVWGWSGGGTMTLNLLFKFPELYQTGIAIAAVSNQLTYDNIYQERYMGLPSENMEDFLAGSPNTYAKNLEGNLLIIHGTADDNVHYQSAEMLINELIKENKPFDMMAYPNRSHGIYEGKNTRKHLYSLITKYVMEHSPVE